MAAAPTKVLTLADLRQAAAAVLAPVEDTDPDVIVDVVDAVTPPALMLLWGDPWLSSGVGAPTMGACLFTAHLQVLCIGGRVEPGPGIEQLEALVAYVIERFNADPYTWPLESISGPRVFEISALSYLGTRVGYGVPITT